MLFLHGYLSKKESFYYQINYFSKYFLCDAPDMPGFGNSAPITQPWSVGDYALWLERYIRAAGYGEVYVVAHSFGARVAFKLFSARKNLCGKLLVTGGAGLVKKRSPQYIRRVNAYRRVKKFFPAFAEKHFGSEEYRSLPPVMRESYKLIVNEDLSDCARGITCPTLLIYGAQDNVTPPDEEGAAFAMLTGGKLTLMEGGHFCFCSQAEKFNSLAAAFLL